MLCRYRNGKLKLKFFLVGLVCFTAITAIIYSITYYKEEHDKGDNSYYNYYVHQKDLEQNVSKIIFLWTPLFGKYKEWSWGIGPEPIIHDCDDPNIDGRCLITNHLSMFERADVVLFSLLDIKRVSSNW